MLKAAPKYSMADLKGLTRADRFLTEIGMLFNRFKPQGKLAKAIHKALRDR